MLNKRRRADEPQIHEQALSPPGDSERLTRSFVNDIFNAMSLIALKYISSIRVS